MKKALFSLLIAGLFSTNTFAEKASFTGTYLGTELQSVKHKFSIPYSELGYYNGGEVTASSSQTLGVSIIAGYGLDYSNNLVGLFEGKLNFNNAKTKAEGETITQAQLGADLAYLQGIQINNNFLPYLKIGLSTQTFKINDNLFNTRRVRKQRDGVGIGLIYGVGTKVSLNENFNLSIEYSKANLRDSNQIKYKVDTIGLNLSYSF